MPTHVDQLRDEGYAIVRGVFTKAEMAELSAAVDTIAAEAVTHRTTYRDHNLLYEVLDDPALKRRVVIQAHWAAWRNPVIEAQRRHPKYLALLEPLLGNSLRQITNQIHWKPPGAKYTFYRFHQDLRFREDRSAVRNDQTSYVTTGLAIDRQTALNGALRVFPRSHTKGYLGLSEGGTIMTGSTPDEEIRKAGLDPDAAITCEMEPGDLLMWTLYTVHGSGPNRADYDRRFLLNSYIRAADTNRGEWAFRDGVSTPLGATPELCKYEMLRAKPGPFYIEDNWTDEAKAAAMG